MTIDLDPDEVVSKINQRANKTIRRVSNRRSNTLDLPIKREKRRERPAYIRAQAQKEAEREQSERRNRVNLHRTQGGPKRLARTVTDYILKKGGEIRGDNLNEIYEILAWAILNSESAAANKQIEHAVDYACTVEWLEKQECADDEAKCCIPLPCVA